MLELDLAVAWAAGQLPGPFTTADGHRIDVVHRGSWTHGFGPDFRDGMVSIDSRHLLSGSIELHLKTSAWREHGHHLDPRYNDVILHVVVEHGGHETRRHDGGLVAVVAVPADQVPIRADEAKPAWDWSLVGGEVCAAALTREQPTRVRDLLHRLGDERLAGRVAKIEARLSSIPPAEVLYLEIWDGLGFAMNREPMRRVAATLRLAAIEQLLPTVDAADRLHLLRGLLFGVAGFLPLAPSDASMARLPPGDVARAERFWSTHGGAWRGAAMSPLEWNRARVRPANHPIARLSAGAALIANASAGLLPQLLAIVRERRDAVAAIRGLTMAGDLTGIGDDRAQAILASGIVPFAFALAEQNGDNDLHDAASQLWERLPSAAANEATRRATRQVAGAERLSGLGGRGQQGLIHLDQTLCAPRRCFECPIAAAVLGGDPSG